MSTNFKILFDTIKTLHALEDEFNKPFGWLNFKSKRYYKKTKNKIIDAIHAIENDDRNLEFFVNFEKAIIEDYKYIKQFMDAVSIPDYEDEINPITRYRTFSTLYIALKENQLCSIYTSGMDRDILYDIVNTSTGKTLHLSIPAYEILNNKLGNVCIDILIKNLIRYVNREAITPQEQAKKLLANTFYESR